jgi:hypothetical protein
MNIVKHLSVNGEDLINSDFSRELFMESYLIENPNVLALDADDFSSVEILGCEFSIEGGRTDKNTDGRIDILANYGEDYTAIIELKKGILNDMALTQLKSYLGKKEKLINADASWKDKIKDKWIGVLVGKDIEPELVKKIKSGEASKDNNNEGKDIIPIYALTLQRFKDRNENMYVSSNAYRYDTKHTQYSYKNTTYGKGRLVLAVIKDYVSSHPDVTCEKLHEVFPDKLQGSSIFTTKDEAEKVFNDTHHKRNFIGKDEPIQLKDKIIAVSNQWGDKNIPNFLKRCEELKINVIIVVK